MHVRGVKVACALTDTVSHEMRARGPPGYPPRPENDVEGETWTGFVKQRVVSESLGHRRQYGERNYPNRNETRVPQLNRQAAGECENRVCKCPGRENTKPDPAFLS